MTGKGVGGLNGREEGKPWDGRGVLGGEGPAHPERPQRHIPIPGPGMLQPRLGSSRPGGFKGAVQPPGAPQNLPQLGKDPICASFTPIFAPAVVLLLHRGLFPAWGRILLVPTRCWGGIEAPAPLISLRLRFDGGFRRWK